MSMSGYVDLFAGEPQLENNATPRHPIGTKGVTPDGRIFRYAKTGATALSVAQLQVQADLTANHEDIIFASAGSVGDKTISVTLGATAVVANEYVDGYVVIVDGTGEGYTHRIKRHDASSAGGEDITIDLYIGLQAATVVASTVTLVRNPYMNVVVATGGDQSDLPAGVALRAVTSTYYCWLQTGGIGSVLSSGTNTPTAGEPVTIGEADNGSLSGYNAVTEPHVGIALTGVAPTSGEHNPYFLMLDR